MVVWRHFRNRYHFWRQVHDKGSKTLFNRTWISLSYFLQALINRHWYTVGQHTRFMIFQTYHIPGWRPEALIPESPNNDKSRNAAAIGGILRKIELLILSSPSFCRKGTANFLIDFAMIFAWETMFLTIVVIALVAVAVKGAWNQPTMKGVIISLIIGMLPLYLILCIFGVMGDKRDKANKR